MVKGHKRVVTTNIGWDPMTERNNMGAGTVLEACSRVPEIARLYGRFCRLLRENTPVITLPRLVNLMATQIGYTFSHATVCAMQERLDDLIFFPVKPLMCDEDPSRSWDQKAWLPLIERSAAELALIPGKIALTLPGCGNGGLDPAEVLPVLERHLADNRFLLVDWRDDEWMRHHEALHRD